MQTIIKIREAIRKLSYILDTNQKRLGVLVFVCSIMAAVLETIGVSVILPLIDAMVEPEELMQKPYIAPVAGVLGIDSGEKLIVSVVIGVIAVYLFKNLFFILNAWLKVKYSLKVQREISVKMLEKYMKRGYAYFLDHNYGQLRQGIDGDVRLLYYIISNILQITTQFFMILFIGLYMVYVDWQLALGAILAGLLCLMVILVIFRRRMAKAGHEVRLLSIRVEQSMEETLHGIKEIMIAKKQRFFVDKYDRESKERNKADAVRTVGAELPAYIIEMISISGIMIILCIRVLSLENAAIYMAVLGSFAVGMFRILPALGKVSSSVNAIISCMSGLDAIYANMSYEDPDINTEVSDKCPDIGFEKEIAISGLKFRYNKDSDLVLNGVDLKIEKGMSVALVGESGAGKSTLADIILGLLKPEEGTVSVDGVVLDRLDDDWWKRVGYVPQSIFLTDASIMENIAYGVRKEDIDIEKVRSALRRAELLEFVESLENGLYTPVGDRGVRLSGGQRQRIGIARALYNSPDILVLDEATSALDNETETAVMESVESLMGNITMIIIAHRLTTIRNCDLIYEIKDGKVISRKYEEL